MSFNEFSIFPRVVTQKCCHHFMWFAWFYRFNRYLPNVICKVWEVCQGNMVVQAQLSSSAFNILHQSFIFTFYWSVHMYSSEHTAITVMVISIFNFRKLESFWTFENFIFNKIELTLSLLLSTILGPKWGNSHFCNFAKVTNNISGEQ